jgi:hypothetical protein
LYPFIGTLANKAKIPPAISGRSRLIKLFQNSTTLDKFITHANNKIETTAIIKQVLIIDLFTVYLLS